MLNELVTGIRHVFLMLWPSLRDVFYGPAYIGIGMPHTSVTPIFQHTAPKGLRYDGWECQNENRLIIIINSSFGNGVLMHGIKFHYNVLCGTARYEINLSSQVQGMMLGNFGKQSLVNNYWYSPLNIPRFGLLD